MEQKTLWFATYLDAFNFARKWKLDQQPEARDVWLDLAWRQEWSLRVPMDWEIPLRNNQHGEPDGI
jgi:hypothetical protein